MIPSLLICRYLFSPSFKSSFWYARTSYWNLQVSSRVFSKLTILLVMHLTRFHLALSRFCLLFLVFLACFLLTLSRFFACFRSLFWQAFTLKRLVTFILPRCSPFLSPLVFRVSNAVKKYIIGHLHYLVSSIYSFELVLKALQFDTFERKRLSKITQTSLFLQIFPSIAHQYGSAE